MKDTSATSFRHRFQSTSGYFRFIVLSGNPQACYMRDGAVEVLSGEHEQFWTLPQDGSFGAKSQNCLPFLNRILKRWASVVTMPMGRRHRTTPSDGRGGPSPRGRPAYHDRPTTT